MIGAGACWSVFAASGARVRMQSTRGGSVPIPELVSWKAPTTFFALGFSAAMAMTGDKKASKLCSFLSLATEGVYFQQQPRRASLYRCYISFSLFIRLAREAWSAHSQTTPKAKTNPMSAHVQLLRVDVAVRSGQR
jgi:hypothetical protein